MRKVCDWILLYKEMDMKNNDLKLQKGLSLIELMISLAIGIILLLALASLIVTASRSSAQRTTSELLDEGARQVFSRLEKDLYHAGYVDAFYDTAFLTQTFNIADAAVMARYARQQANISDNKQATLLSVLTGGKIQPLRGCNSDFEGDPSSEETVCNDNTAPVNDGKTFPQQSLQVAYQAVRNEVASANISAGHAANQFSSLPLASSNPGERAARTCALLNAEGNHPIIINRYFLSLADKENYRSFACESAVKSFDNSAKKDNRQPIVLGIEQLAFRYLVTPSNMTPADASLSLRSDPSGRTVLNYLHANQIDSGGAALGWASVVGVEACVVVAAEPLDGTRERDISNIQSVVPNCLRVDNGNDANTAFAPDLPRPDGDTRLYRRYVRTISLPNSLYVR